MYSSTSDAEPGSDTGCQATGRGGTTTLITACCRALPLAGGAGAGLGNGDGVQILEGGDAGAGTGRGRGRGWGAPEAKVVAGAG